MQGSGCGSVIDLLVSCLADKGDGILVARPFYNGFSASFECRSGVLPIGVELTRGKEADASSVDDFERAYIKSEKEGVKIRAVMLANPNNPLGFCYSKETLLAYCRFVEKYDLHLISDEIYALSVYDTPGTIPACFETPSFNQVLRIIDDPDAQRFVSLLSVDALAEAGCSPARIHVIYGASKVHSFP